MSSFLTLRAAGANFAIRSEHTKEIVEIPAISPWPGSPESILGVVDYRGKILPVIDISLRLGGPAQLRSRDHQLMVVKVQDREAALLIEKALDLREMENLPMKDSNLPAYLTRASNFLLGLAKHEGQVLLVLDLAAVLDYSEQGQLEPASLDIPVESDPLLLERAKLLSQTTALLNEKEKWNLLVVRLGGERFGLEVSEVRELATCPAITQVPGSPEHLLGLAYHRGELIRLIDIRKQCNLPTDSSKLAEIVVLNGPGMRTGIVVEGIESVISEEKTEQKAIFSEGWLTILDLENLEVREPISSD